MLGDEDALHQVFGCNTAHAYLVSASAADRLLERLPQPPEIWQWLTRHRAVDRFYYRNLSPGLTVVALSPALIDQDVYGHGGWSGAGFWIHPSAGVAYVLLTKIDSPGFDADALDNAIIGAL